MAAFLGGLSASVSTVRAQETNPPASVEPFRILPSDTAPARPDYVAPFEMRTEDLAPVTTVTVAADKAGRIITYQGDESAGLAAITNNDGEAVEFLDSSTADRATIVNNSGGAARFTDNASGGSALVTNNAGSTVEFSGQSSADGANITNNGEGTVRFGGTSSGGNAAMLNNGMIAFQDSASAENANIVSNEGAALEFSGESSAGRAQIANSGAMSFAGKSSGADALVTNNGGGTLSFGDRSTAARSVITNNGETVFAGQSSGGESTIVNNRTGSLAFRDSSNAGSGLITNNGSVAFEDASSAGGAELVNNGTGTVDFRDDSTLGQAHLNNGGVVRFSGSSSGGAGSILTGPDGRTYFSGASTAGQATLETDEGGIVDFSGVTTGTVSAGSIAGPGSYFLGGNLLMVGADDLSKTVDGAIADGGAEGGVGGALTKVGTGILILAGANTYTGATTVSEGTLQAGAEKSFSAASSVVVEDKGLLALAGFDQRLGSLAGGGTVDLATADLTAGGNGTSTAFSGVIGGTGGLTKEGAGSLELSGVSTYTGNTDIVAGKLLISGSIAQSAVTVGENGWLGGNGTVGSTTVEGMLARTNDGTPLTVNGDLTFGQDSTYQLTLDPANTASSLVVTGVATVGGAALEVLPTTDRGFEGNRYTILTASEIDGTFDLVTDNAPFLDIALFYQPQSIALEATRNGRDFANVARTFNQRQTANGLQSVGGGDAFAAVVALPTDAAARAAFDALSGEIHATLAARLMEDGYTIRSIILDQAGRRDANGDRPRFWVSPFGETASVSGDGNAADYDASWGGVIAGGDVPIGGDWRIGFAGGYGQGSLDIDARSSHASTDTAIVGAYATGALGGFDFQLGVSNAWNSIDTDRSVAVGEFRDRLTASYGARTAQAFGEIGYDVKVGQTLVLKPFAEMAYVRSDRDAFSERGGDAALVVRGASDATGFATLGLSARQDLDFGTGLPLAVHGTLGWRHGLSDGASETRMAFAGGDIFTIGGVPLARNVGIVDLGLEWTMSPATLLGLSYSGQFGSGLQDHTLIGTLRARF